MDSVRIIHTNDIHSSYEEFLRMVTIIKKYSTDETLLLDAGDFNDYSSFITKGTNGYAGLKMLSLLNYKALTIGNNEGFQDVDVIEASSNYKLLDILSCNISKLNDEKIKGIKSSMIYKANGYRFLVIGISPYHYSYNQFYNFHDVKAFFPNDIIRKEIKDKKGQYDFVIALSHLGLKADIMLAQSIPSIDIIISGHSHHTMDCVKVNNSYIHQSGVRGSNVGQLDIQIENGKIVDIIDKNYVIDDSVPQDEEFKKLLDGFKKDAYNNLNYKVANIDQSLYFAIDKESNFPNLIADYIYKKYDVDFALINSGLTEANLNSGDITYNDVLNACNSPLQMETMEVQGKYILEAIKLSSTSEKCNDTYRRAGFRGKFLGKLHVSYNCYINENNQLFINNQLIDNEKYYKIATTDYFQRGMGYEVLVNNRNAIMYKEGIIDTIIEALNDKDSFKHINEFRWR